MEFRKVLRASWKALKWLLEMCGTLLYREMLKRNTVRPMERIIKEPNQERKRRLLRDWAQMKSNESTYVQLAVRSPHLKVVLHTC